MSIVVASDEEDIERKIGEIRKKVVKHSGQVVLSVRNIVTNEAEGCFSSSNLCYYTETGIICGDFEERSPVQTFDNLNLFLRGGIKLPVIFSSEHLLADTYSYSHDVRIPIQRKLSRTGFGAFGGHFRFFPDELKKSEKGTIDFGKLELGGGLAWRPGYKKETPYLQNLDVLVGNDEVREFMGGKIIPSDIEDFFGLLAPGELEKRVAEYDGEQRQNLARTLVQEVAGLCTIHYRILEIREEVLRAKAGIDTDEEGRHPDVVWGGDADRVENYRGLKKRANTSIGSIRECVEKAGEVDLPLLSGIDGRLVGIPAVVSVADYLAYVQGTVLSEVGETIKVLDTHLKQESERVETEIKERYR